MAAARSINCESNSLTDRRAAVILSDEKPDLDDCKDYATTNAAILGNTMSGLTTLIWLPLAIVVAYFIYTFNRLVSHRNACTSARASIDVNLTRRHDLIPNLVQVVDEQNLNTRIWSKA